LIDWLINPAFYNLRRLVNRFLETDRYNTYGTIARCIDTAWNKYSKYRIHDDQMTPIMAAEEGDNEMQDVRDTGISHIVYWVSLIVHARNISWL